MLSQDESWWDGLYDYERDLAEFLVSIAPDISEQVYLGQDLEQCLEILDTGVSAQDFFRGTVFDGLEREIWRCCRKLVFLDDLRGQSRW